MNLLCSWPLTSVNHFLMSLSQKLCSCEFCGKGFSQNSDLTARLRIHTGVKLYICKTCRKCLQNHSSVASHVRIYMWEKLHLEKKIWRGSASWRHSRGSWESTQRSCILVNCAGNGSLRAAAWRSTWGLAWAGSRFLRDVWEKFQKQQQPAGRHENHRVENGEASRRDATELKHQITDDGEIICDWNVHHPESEHC